MKKSQFSSSLDRRSVYKFFEEEVSELMPFEIPITNPRYIQKVDFDENENEKPGQKSNRSIVFDYLQK